VQIKIWKKAFVLPMIILFCPLVATHGAEKVVSNWAGVDFKSPSQSIKINPGSINNIQYLTENLPVEENRYQDKHTIDGDFNKLMRDLWEKSPGPSRDYWFNPFDRNWITLEMNDRRALGLNIGLIYNIAAFGNVNPPNKMVVALWMMEGPNDIKAIFRVDPPEPDGNPNIFTFFVYDINSNKLLKAAVGTLYKKDGNNSFPNKWEPLELDSTIMEIFDVIKYLAVSYIDLQVVESSENPPNFWNLKQN
jgi:hypothetical protein